MLARNAGADVVVNPVRFGGQLLAGSTMGPHIADYIGDLARSDGRVALHERAATPDEVGRPLSATATGLGVRVLRGERTLGFWRPEVRALEAG